MVTELFARGTIDVPRIFVLRRGPRIWPFYFVFVLWLIVTTELPVCRVLARRTVCVELDLADGNVSGGWSLSIEEQF